MTDKKDRNLKIWLGVVLAIAIMIRLALFLTYPPVSYDDTASYRRSAEAILEGLEDYDGTRTPGYPAFLALIGTDQAVYAVQLFLGICITMVWFVIGYLSTGKPLVGALAALFYTLNPALFFFEGNLLTETLTTFWLALLFMGAFIWLKSPKCHSIWLALGIGLVSALAALTRPLFIFMPVWLVLFLAVSIDHKKLKIDWKPTLGILLPAVILIGGWMSWINSRYQAFSLTTMTGYHLVQHTGYYFEDVPDAYADLRDVYLEYRQERMDEFGTQGNTIWGAIPAMKEVSGLGFYELSKTLQSISVHLILTHPLLYLSRVLKGWWLFWRAPVYWNSSAIGIPFLRKTIEFIILGSRGVIFISNMVFILSSMASLVSEKLRKIWHVQTFLWLLAGSVWATSILSSLLDHGDNPRFLIPVQIVVLFWVLSLGYHTWQHRQNKLEVVEVQNP